MVMQRGTKVHNYQVPQVTDHYRKDPYVITEPS